MRDKGIHPPLDFPYHKSTKLRHPKEPLVYLPHTHAERTGSRLGTDRIGRLDSDLTGTTGVIADAVVERWLTPACAVARPGLAASLRAMLVATPAEGYAACCAAIERMDLRDDLSRITAPALVVSGRDDPAAPVGRPREVTDLMLRHLEEGRAA